MGKVRVGTKYLYDPTLLDILDKPFNIKEGDIVKVVNLPGCPKANVMNHCYVNHLNGSFAGLVCCRSLTKLTTN